MIEHRPTDGTSIRYEGVVYPCVNGSVWTPVKLPRFNPVEEIIIKEPKKKKTKKED